jgi:hypothetical protein
MPREPIAYAVTVTGGDNVPADFRIVRANSRQQAIRYVAKATIRAEPATFADGRRAAENGIEEEDATGEEDPAPAATPLL